MSAQTTYSLFQGNALNGQVIDITYTKVISRSAEGAVPFGTIVSRGTDLEKQCVVGDGDVLGIAVRDIAREYALRGDTTTQYADETNVSIAYEGTIALKLAAGGDPGDALFYDDTTGVIDVGTASTGETQLTGFSLDTVTAAGGVGIVRFRIL